MSTRRAAAVIAGLLLAIGLFVGLSPVSVADDTTCGSAFMPTTRVAEAKTVVGLTTDGPAATDYLALCNDAIGVRRLLAIPLAGLGAIAGLFLLLTAKADESTSARTRPARQ